MRVIDKKSRLERSPVFSGVDNYWGMAFPNLSSIDLKGKCYMHLTI
jgi:hypothetical protein